MSRLVTKVEQGTRVISGCYYKLLDLYIAGMAGYQAIIRYKFL